MAESSGQKPLVDLLHPRKPPKPPSHRKTALLAASIGLVFFAWIAWRATDALQAPLVAAAAAEEKLAETTKELEGFRSDLQQAQALNAWEEGAANVLFTLQELSAILRTQPLEAKPFPADIDTVVKRWSLTACRLELEGYTPNVDALKQLESRLRNTPHRVHRKMSESSGEVRGYPWHYEFLVDIASTDNKSEGQSP